MVPTDFAGGRPASVAPSRRLLQAAAPNSVQALLRGRVFQRHTLATKRSIVSIITIIITIINTTVTIIITITITIFIIITIISIISISPRAGL